MQKIAISLCLRVGEGALNIPKTHDVQISLDFHAYIVVFISGRAGIKL